MRLIEVKVKPRSRESRLVEQEGGTWIARIKAPPVDGKANAELIKLVADHFDLRRNQVEIKTGAKGRLKRIRLRE